MAVGISPGGGCRSVYDPEIGFGFNHSNNILTWEGRGLQTGTAPCNKEWCLLEL